MKNIRVLYEGWCGTSITRGFGSRSLDLQRLLTHSTMAFMAATWNFNSHPSCRALLSRYTLYLNGFFQPKIGKNGQWRTLERLPNLFDLASRTIQLFSEMLMLRAWDVLTPPGMPQKQKKVDNHRFWPWRALLSCEDLSVDTVHLGPRTGQGST